MAYHGLADFICALEKNDEIHRIKTFVDPVLEITEIADRVSKNKGKALLFENNGTDFPLLINIFGSEKRLAMSFSRNDTDSVADEVNSLFKIPGRNIFGKIISAIRILRIIPSRSSLKGRCQKVINMEPDLDSLPVMKCWPWDGGRFITLPVVHTVHPETGKTNAGMYRMQILDKKSTGMHWQLHKTGAAHFEEYKKRGLRMPVSVSLGGDPVYTYAATAPMPENIDEYILAGFIRRKRVKLVKCITNNLWVPDDADIIIEGYVDPAEETVTEGPFGDHTGFYSLTDKYPVFHVTCITCSKSAVYPSTIVGVPPCEDTLLIKATEKIFLPAMRLALQPEIIDFHMPDAGVAHNLVIVKINKTYPRQGQKIISSFYGAGQLMFTKFIVVVSGGLDIRNYTELLQYIPEHTDLRNDLLFTYGPLDVLDHSSDTFASGGKLGIDATEKLPPEISVRNANATSPAKELTALKEEMVYREYGGANIVEHLNLVVIGVNLLENQEKCEILKEYFRHDDRKYLFRLVIAVDHNIDVNDLFMVSWQVLGNTDPQRDIEYLSDNSLFVDATIKCFHSRPFPRRWPNIVCSDNKTIESIDRKWKSLGIGEHISSPSVKNLPMSRYGEDEVKTSRV